MMQKQEIQAFFDACAPSWDAEMIRSDRKIGIILDNAGVKKGMKVLDVACGTGVLIPDYLSREVASVTAIDLSPEMIRIAKEKFPQKNVTFLCGDVQTTQVGSGYDAIVVYNAFPHFPEPEKLISVLSGCLKKGGTLTVAHGMSRAQIDAHHHGAASHVSMGLMEENRLAELFSKYLNVTTVLSNEELYQVVGCKA